MSAGESAAFMSGYVSRVLKVLNKYQNPYPLGSWEYEDWLNGYITRKHEEYAKIYSN